MRIKLPKMLEAAVLNAIGYELIDDEEDEEDEEEIEGDNLIVVDKTRKILREVEDDWVKNYLIN